MLADRTIPRRLAHLSIVTAVALATLAVAITEASAASADPVDQPSCTQDTCVFLLAKGRLTAFDAPGPAAQDLVRINNRGQIVGGTREAVADEGFRGFLRDRRGRFTRIDFPGAAGTSPFDINDRGQIVGIYSNTDRTRGARMTSAASCSNRRRVHHDRMSPEPCKRRPSASTIAARSWASTSTQRQVPRVPVGEGAVHDDRRAGRRRRHPHSTSTTAARSLAAISTVIPPPLPPIQRPSTASC